MDSPYRNVIIEAVKKVFGLFEGEKFTSRNASRVMDNGKIDLVGFPFYPQIKRTIREPKYEELLPIMQETVDTLNIEKLICVVIWHTPGTQGKQRDEYCQYAVVSRCDYDQLLSCANVYDYLCMGWNMIPKDGFLATMFSAKNGKEYTKMTVKEFEIILFKTLTVEQIWKNTELLNQM